MVDFKLIHGIYESVITHALEERLSRISDSFDLEKNQLDSGRKFVCIGAASDQVDCQFARQHQGR